MSDNTPVKKKSIGFILQADRLGRNKLLVYSYAPNAPFRLPGGNVDPGETIEEALHREILEETGLSNLTFLRKLGVKSYYKEHSHANVERHDFLLMTNGELPDTWEFIVLGKDKDKDALFKYQWIDIGQIDLVDEEFRRDITTTYIKELFS